MKFFSFILIVSLAITSCGVKKLSKQDCVERKTIKVYVLPFRHENPEFDTYKEIEKDLYRLCYSVLSRSQTLSGVVIPKEQIYKRVKDSLGIDLYNDWRGLIQSQLREVGRVLNVDYIVYGTTSARTAYRSTEFFTTCAFLNVQTGESEKFYDNKFVGKIIYENTIEVEEE